MFDIGFTEIFVVAIVGLMVLGPERLPVAIRTGAKWLSKLKQEFAAIKAEIDKELGTEQLQAQLRTESIANAYEKERAALEALDEKAHSSNIEFLDSLVMSDDEPTSAVRDAR